MKRPYTILGCLGLIGLLGMSVYWCFGWSRINCWTHEINIATGHTRYTRYWFWYPTERRVESTWASEALGPSPEETGPDHWMLTLIQSRRTRHSPNFTFRAAARDISQVKGTFQYIEAGAEARRKLAETMVWLWLQFDDPYVATKFLDDTLLQNNNVLNRGHLTADDIPSLESWLGTYRQRVATDEPTSEYLQIIDNALVAAKSPSP